MEKNKAKRRSRTMDSHKIVIVGGNAVGKSALTFLFMYDEFVEFYDSTKVDSYRKYVLMDDMKIKVHVVDTTGRDLDALDNYFLNGEGFLCVFSVTDDRSFEATTELRDRILRVNEKYKQSGESVPFILVGSKGDLKKKRKVTMIEAEARAAEWGVPYVETSALKRDNVDKVFLDLLHEISVRKNMGEKEVCSAPKKKKKRRRIKLKCVIV